MPIAPPPPGLPHTTTVSAVLSQLPLSLSLQRLFCVENPLLSVFLRFGREQRCVSSQSL